MCVCERERKRVYECVLCVVCECVCEKKRMCECVLCM